jgi:thioredoxin 1
MATTKVTDSTFENDVLAAPGPVLVDFWAEWCGPCKAIAPGLEEISETLKGKVTIAKINIDENPQTPGRYNVSAIPTLILFKNGQVAAQKIGGAPKSKLVEWLQEQI